MAKSIFNGLAISERMPEKFGGSTTRHSRVMFFLKGFNEAMSAEELEAFEAIITEEVEEIKARIKAAKKAALKKEAT